MKRNKFGLLLTMAMILLSVLDCKAAKNENDSVRVLWIGNSYTFFNDLPAMVRDIAETKGVKMAYSEVLKGGERLKGHLENPRLLQLLKKGGWDYVVVQENSYLPA